VFLTDGLPTVGTTDVDQLLQKARTANTSKARVFVFGVGSDVNTRLLDTLAQESRGDRDYVQPGENIESKTGDLFAKLSGPVMTDLQLTVDGVPVMDQEPRLLPDLFVQGQMVVVGRYHGGGHSAIRLRGRVGQDVREYVFEASFAGQGGDGDWIPSLWAQKRVAALLDAIRLNGQQPELVAEVTRLGKEFGLVTPYTSHLVVEEGRQIAQFRGVAPGSPDPSDPRTLERLRRDWQQAGTGGDGGKELVELFAESKKQADAARGSFLAGPATGAAAVERSKDLRALAGDGLAAGRVGAAALLHQRVRDRTFHLVQGIWIDAAFTAEMQARVQRIEAFSEPYFALLRARPQLAPYLAFSSAIVVVDGGEAFEIVPGA
jgi:Ca-activated chloride channel family protein